MRALFLSLLVAVVTLGVGADLTSASTCGDRVVADWSDGRIDGVYKLSCYDEAVDGLPEDVRVYSSAVDDISRALQARLRAASGRTPAGEIDPTAALPSPASSNAAQPPLALVLLAGSVTVFAVAGAGCWIVQTRRRRA